MGVSPRPWGVPPVIIHFCFGFSLIKHDKPSSHWGTPMTSWKPSESCQAKPWWCRHLDVPVMKKADSMGFHGGIYMDLPSNYIHIWSPNKGGQRVKWDSKLSARKTWQTTVHVVSFETQGIQGIFCVFFQHWQQRLHWNQQVTSCHNICWNVLRKINQEPTETKSKTEQPTTKSISVKLVRFPPAQIHRTRPCGRTSSACRVRKTRCFPRSVPCWLWASGPPAGCCEAHAWP